MEVKSHLYTLTEASSKHPTSIASDQISIRFCCDPNNRESLAAGEGYHVYMRQHCANRPAFGQQLERSVETDTLPAHTPAPEAAVWWEWGRRRTVAQVVILCP